jgi:hypothetical protein
MDTLIKHIEKQFESSLGKNILTRDANLCLQFINGTDTFLEKLFQLNNQDLSILIDFITNKSIEEFCNQNQYYSFDSKSVKELNKVYYCLFFELKNKKKDLIAISNEHYTRLRKWLIESNPFALKLYSTGEKEIEIVPCSEYSLLEQIEVLQIDLTEIQEPILDIGCGKSKKLINYFNSIGLNAYGIDRITNDSSNSKRIDWLEFEYKENSWGTIVSNLGFSNHFKHHNLRIDGNYIAYAKKYMLILESLKPGGKFHYAPDLPFVEEFLDKSKYRLIRHEITNTGYFGVKILKLK